jgi:CpeT protein
MKRTQVMIGLVAASSMSGCSITQNRDGGDAPSVKTLEQHLTGSFSSSAQATQDPEFFEIVLHMVPIWEGRADGPWLYVEQAVATAADRPYRQRVYHLAQTGDNEFVSTVYSFEDAMSYAGAYADEFPLSDLAPEDLTIREGCAITVAWDDAQQAFVGSTNGRDCVSNLRGSTYATSEVFLHLDRLITWDRGFDDNDEQVWGAVKGGYIFDRVQ